MLERRRLALKSGSAYEGLFTAVSRFESASDRIPEVDLRRAVSRCGWLKRAHRNATGYRWPPAVLVFVSGNAWLLRFPPSPLAPRLPPTVASDR